MITDALLPAETGVQLCEFCGERHDIFTQEIYRKIDPFSETSEYVVEVQTIMYCADVNMIQLEETLHPSSGE